MFDFGKDALSAPALAKFWEEAALHYTLRHDHVVTMHGATADESDAPPTYAIVLQRMSSSLHDAIYGPSAATLAAPRRLQLLHQVRPRRLRTRMHALHCMRLHSTCGRRVG